MTTPDKVLDGGSETPEVALAKPTFEQSSQPNPSELSAEAIAEQKFEQRLKDTEEKLRREFQSKLDKDTANIRKTYGDLSEVQQALAEVKAGGDPDKVYAALEQRNLYQKVADLESKLSAPTQPSQNGKSEADEAFDKAVGLVTKAGLANDPEIQELFKGFKGTPNDFILAVGEKVIGRNTKVQPAAASATSPAGGAGSSTSREAAQAKVDGLLAKVASGTKAERVKAKAELDTAYAELQKLEA